MIGVITNDMVEVGYYEQAQKIVKAALTIAGALQTVMNSRIANAYSQKDQKEIKSCLGISINFVWFLTIPMMLGLIAVAPKFVPWYYGEGFDGVTPILIATAPILIAIGLSGITGVQYLIQIGKSKEFTISVTIGAITNIIFNIILIHFFGGVGAAIASVIAEITILLIQLRYFKEQFNIKEILNLSMKCFISGIVMFLAVKLVVYYLPVSILNTVIEILIGGIVYIAMLFVLKYKFLTDIYNLVINKIKEVIAK